MSTEQAFAKMIEEVYGPLLRKELARPPRDYLMNMVQRNSLWQGAPLVVPFNAGPFPERVPGHVNYEELEPRVFLDEFDEIGLDQAIADMVVFGEARIRRQFADPEPSPEMLAYEEAVDAELRKLA